MNLKTIWFITSMMLTSVVLFAQDENQIKDYIEQYKSLAIAEQLRSGIPAAITLAQGIHESTAGLSELATKGNNHFGIKCKSTWMGETMLHDDDKKQECFRKYVSAEQSYIDHSDFLKGSNRYHFLFDLDRTDYVGWASGLKRAGYATNPLYVKKLTDLVEKFNLQQYTYEAISKSSKTNGEVIPNDDKPVNLTHMDDPSTFYKGLKGFWAAKGETLLPKALEKNIRYAKLLSMNDLADEPLQTDMFVFIEKKRKVGTEEFHIVKAAETMLLIAQKEAMMLASLYTLNNLIPGQEPEIGERLALQYKSYETPKIKQQFLKAFEQGESSDQVIVKVEKKSITESVPALSHQAQEIPIEEPKKMIEPKVEKKITEEVTKPVSVKKGEFTETTQVIVVEKEKAAELMAEKKRTEELTKPNVSENTTKPAEEKIVETPVPAPDKQTIQEVKKANTPVQKLTENELKNKNLIIDEDKAKRIDQLLNSQPIEKTVTPAAVQESSNSGKKTMNESPFSNRPVENEIKAEPIIQKEVATEIPLEKPTPAPPVIKRTYDETDVNDSVKALKKKFDEIVYSPRPPRKIDTTKHAMPVEQKPVTLEIKKQTIQVTPTGIKREIKKPTTLNREVNAKELKKEAAKKKKESIKKGKDKKETAASAKKKKADKNNVHSKKPEPKKKSTKRK